MEQTILFLRGLPASGKSTFAIQYCKENSNFKRLNKDSIREFMGNPKFSRKFETLVLDIQRKAGEFLLNNGYSIIIDDTNFSEKHYNYWQKIASERGITFILKDFNTPLDECIRRDFEREKSVGKGVILNMYEKYIKNNQND